MTSPRFRYIRSFAVCFFTFFAIAANAQVRCATVEHTANLYKKFNRTPQPEVFEKWLNQRKQTLQQQNRFNRTQAEPYQIPVVVHIIHNGEPVGIGTNISDEQILSQINVLNNDFKRLNADANQTPSAFLSVAGSMDIQFVLARQDPDGAPTSGIVRKKGSKTSYVESDDVQLKAQSYWPSEDYFNIWVCNLSSLLGYAQFPVSDLEGLEEYQGEIAATDGVVISYDAFGSIDDGNFNLLSGFNKGRTLTHETGHFFGLRHIWGDNSSCTSTTDYVDDTPKQNDDTNGCPSHPQTSCSTTKMFQNFMDYTHDPCMNIFTQGQMARMRIVIENSIRRASLLNSLGLVSPTGGINDVALRSILSPEPVSCATNSTLKIRFQNLGDTDLSYLQVSRSIDNETAIISDHVFSPVAAFAYGEISIPFSVTEGEHTLKVSVNFPNGEADSNTADNELSRRFAISSFAEELPTRERFENTFDDRWTLVNPNPAGTASWETGSTFYDQSLLVKHSGTYSNEPIWLVSPVLNLTNVLESNLRFDWSYLSTSSNLASLKLKYTTDCGATYQDLTDFSLSQTSESFPPSSQEDWDTSVIGLEPLVGFAQTRLALVAYPSAGNSFYLDNIEFYLGEASLKLPIEEVVAIYPKTGGGLNLTFNVAEKQTVVVSLYDMMGRTIVHGVEPNTLNQTVSLELENLQTGIYIVQMKIDGQFYSQKVFIPAR